MKINVIKADITELKVDAVVNAANNSLLGGGGVDGAIHRKAGAGLLKECKKIGGCETGSAVITKAYNLPCQYVIHAVGPVYSDGMHNESELLASAYKSSLIIAENNNIRSVAFPNISTGVYGYPKDKACLVVKEVVEDLQKNNKGIIENIIFCCFDNENLQLYLKIFKNFI
jgi:O-acetyl-ADP-ribose deacetylase (regulator of RNase III)